jgi:lysophospholipase L1-like esterase
MRSFVSSLLLAAAAALAAVPLQAAEPAVPWVATWAAAARDYNQPPIAGIPPPAPASLKDQTVRLRLLPAVGGNEVRVRFSNVFGKAPLHIHAASVARSTGADALSPRAIQPMLVDGRPDFTVAPGAERWSDAVRLAVQPQQPLAVSFHAADAHVATVFQASDATAWVANGDATRAATLPAPGKSDWGHVVTGVDVLRRPSPAVVVAFGDSITQGAGAADSLQGGYPARLAQRLRAPSSRSDAPSVVNVGIGGNRLLTDGIGPKALDRFERDVLQQSGVTHTIILIGTNDIGHDAAALAGDAVPVNALTAGLQQLVDRARSRGVKVLLGTVTPFKGSGYFNEATEAKRQAINRWIRGRQDVDGVIDFDAALRDRADPQALNAAFDSGDHLHPGDAGYAAMAAAIDVRELRE